jgi:hypothetical protein
MTDLTKIDKPLGLLDAETKAALRAHFSAGGKIMFFSVHGWLPATSLEPSSYTYRAAPSPVTADELAEALRRRLPVRSVQWMPEEEAHALLARYDAQKGAGND